jgi:hypothetical protein
MAEKQPWQNQNMKKSGIVAGPSSMNSKITGNSFHCDNAKISKPTVQNYADGGMATKSITSKTDGWAAHGSREFPKKFADGGMVSDEDDKAAGMKASAGEKIGFFERLRMGNIDQPGSEAYNRLGAGRAQLDRMDAEAEEVRAANRTPTPAKAADAPDLGAFNEAGSGVVNDTKPDAPAPVKAAAKPVARKAPVMAAKASAPAKTASKPSGASLSQRMGKEYADLENAAQAAAKMPQATPESKARVRKMADDARKAYEAAADAEKTGRSVVLKR